MLGLGVVVLGHEDRPGRRIRVRERVRLQPCVERHAVLGTEPVHVDRRELPLTLIAGLDPGVERRDVQQPLLAAERRCVVRLRPEP